MKVNIYLHAPDCPSELLDVNEKGLEAALDDVRQHWNEEPEGSQAFVFTDEAGNLLANMWRHPQDNEKAITVYADGKMVVHHCEYLFNEKGEYEATEVVEHFYHNHAAKQEPVWVNEHSSGYLGQRCQGCGTWVYEGEPKKCDCKNHQG